MMMDSFLIIRVCVVGACALLIFVLSRWRAAERNRTRPRTSVLLSTKILNLILACLIAISVVGQIIDWTSSGPGPADSPPPPAKQTIEEIFQAHLPKSAANAKIVTLRFMTLAVNGTFECSEDDLKAFVRESKLLPDELEPGKNPLHARPRIEWWHPEALGDVSGAECEWEAGADVATCSLVAGRKKGATVMTVYFEVVYENKAQTGARPAVEGDPNWRAKEKEGAE